MKVSTCGIDLAKNVFAVHGVDIHGRPCLRKQLRRQDMVVFFAKMESCLIGMEGCASAHYWARKLTELGHTVKLMAPQFVKPYVKTNKHDAADAEAICEAVSRPSMRFVAIKSVEQQALLALHRARQGFVKARTAQINQIRGLLSEFGIIMPQGIRCAFRELPNVLDQIEQTLPASFLNLMRRLSKNLEQIDRQVAELEAEIKQLHRQNEACRKIADIPGIGPITASAIVASIGDAREFKSGRQLAAWLGLVPRQHSSGGKQMLLGISKRGDSYLRTLLIHGARSVVRVAQSKVCAAHTWLTALMARRNRNIAAVALANKNARIIWALLARDRTFRPDYGAISRL